MRKTERTGLFAWSGWDEAHVGLVWEVLEHVPRLGLAVLADGRLRLGVGVVVGRVPSVGRELDNLGSGQPSLADLDGELVDRRRLRRDPLLWARRGRKQDRRRRRRR